MRSDLHALEQRMELRFDSLENGLRAEFQRDLRTTMLGVMGGNAAIVSVVAALTNLFGY